MQAIHLKRRLDSETLHLPQLRPMVGQDVEIVVFTSIPEMESVEDAAPHGEADPDASDIASIESVGKIVHPDFLARARAIWGDCIPGKPLSEIVSEARGDA